MSWKENVDNTQEYTCLSLCSGYGGLELGLKRACPNVRTVAYVEVEAFADANLVAKMEKGLLDAAPIWTDIKTFDAEPFRDRVHFITAGYPCQPFSVAGQRKGTDDPRHLWPYIERIIEAVRPVWFFGENVSGHLTIGFPEVYRSLRNLGYTVEAGLFTAAEVGVPHRRERLFILAYAGCTQQGGISRNSEKEKGITQKNQEAHRGNPKPSPSSITVADTTTKRIQRPEPERTAQTGRQADQQSVKWPARSGQPQYDWEEPRIVVNTKSKWCGRRDGNNNSSTEKKGKCQQQCISRSKSIPEGQAQSRLGMPTDGNSCRMGKTRVDELRLLGNGVVPQQAEKAFRYLMHNYELERDG